MVAYWTWKCARIRGRIVNHGSKAMLSCREAHNNWTKLHNYSREADSFHPLIMESLHALNMLTYSHCVLDILPLCTHIEQLPQWSEVHSDAVGGTHHCVGLPWRGLPVRNDAHIVAVNTGSNDRTNLSKHLQRRGRTTLWYSYIGWLSFNIHKAHFVWCRVKWLKHCDAPWVHV